MLVVPSNAQTESSVELIKAVWVYKFLNYIEWPDEDKRKTLTISYWGDDSNFYKNLSVLNGRQVRDSEVRVKRQTDLLQQLDAQVIVVGKNNNKLLSKLQRSLAGTNTLVISDNSADKQNIMLNFVYPDANSISFELNRYNIIYEQLSLSSEILVIGGSEVDIAKVLNEMTAKLDKTQVLLDKRENTLNALAVDIARKEQEMLDLQKHMAKQTQEIERTEQQSTSLKKEMNELVLVLRRSHEELTKSYEELASNNKEIDDKQQKLTTKEKDISALSQAISANKLTLAKQLQHIEEQKKTLAAQKESLDLQQKELLTKTSTIERQNTAMIVSLAIIFLVLGILFVLYKSSQSKKKSYEILSEKNDELAKTNEKLINTQTQLVESEKMAALGGLVAGVAHEINTPLGVSVTAGSTCQHLVENFMESVEENKLTRTQMNTFLDKLNQAIGLIMNNLVRANDLIRQFKLVSVDQSSEVQREFLIGEYINEVLSSLYPQYKKYDCDISVNCDEELLVNSFPGGIAQIFTNLVVNSIIHGFELGKKTSINVDVVEEDSNVIITYQDNGSGIDKEKAAHVFTPFYTTKRGAGGSGLGLHICYNIATKLGGDIKCVPCELGAKFVIIMQKELK